MELNPHFDLDAGLPCNPGERQCAEGDLAVEICTQDATGFEPLRQCFTQSHCVLGGCVPDDPVVPCISGPDCSEPGAACTVLVDPQDPARLGTYCLPAPSPTGRLGGQACVAHDQCHSGWCFRSLCFEACGVEAHCTNDQHQCKVLDVTVDGVRDGRSIHGCVP